MLILKQPKFGAIAVSQVVIVTLQVSAVDLALDLGLMVAGEEHFLEASFAEALFSRGLLLNERRFANWVGRAKVGGGLSKKLRLLVLGKEIVELLLGGGVFLFLSGFGLRSALERGLHGEKLLRSHFATFGSV